MNLGIIFLVLALQLVLAFIVIAVLMRSLSKELTEVALEQFEALKSPPDAGQFKEILVLSHAPLTDGVSYRFKSIGARKFKGVPIRFSTDSSLKGGVLIMAGATAIDCSSKKRLEKLWGVRA